jgi:uncharacterized membrane protein
VKVSSYFILGSVIFSAFFSAFNKQAFNFEIVGAVTLFCCIILGAKMIWKGDDK